MSVTWVREIWNGREGGADEQGINAHTRIFRAKTDNKWDDETIVLTATGVPGIGDQHPNDVTSYCRSVRGRNESASPFFWTITSVYSSERERGVDPTADPVQISWSTEQFQRVADKDRNGEGIVNSAGDPFDPPPMRDDSRRSVQIVSNETFVPTWILSYQDAVNNADIVIDGVTVAAGKAKCQQVSVSPEKFRNDISYRTVTLTLHCVNDNWDLKLLDQGFRERDDDDKLKQIKNESDNLEPTAPVLLDGNGKAQTDPTTSSAVYLDFEVYPELDFSALPGIASA